MAKCEELAGQHEQLQQAGPRRQELLREVESTIETEAEADQIGCELSVSSLPDRVSSRRTRHHELNIERAA